MGSRAKRPPLPAATDSDIGGNGPSTRSDDDVATDISRLTERTSYTIPEDGAPVKIPTKKSRDGTVDKQGSQASLLIDLYETKSKGSGRPSVRVRVSSGGQPIKVTEVNKRGKPSQTRRVSFDNHAKQDSVDLEMGHSRGNSDLSNRSPMEVEINNQINNSASEMSSHGGGKMMPASSDISSMPADSMLGHNVELQEPSTSHRQSLSEVEERVANENRDEKPRELSRRRSRSLSRERRERLERKAAEKARLIEGDSPTSTRPRKLRKSRDKSGSNVASEEAAPSKSRRSSRSHSNRESGEYGSGVGTESSLRSADAHSNLSQSNGSNLSKSSLANNPKLLNAVEEAIRRLILPEISEIKRQVTVRDSKGRSNRDSRATDVTRETEDTERSREHGDIKHKKVRRSSRDRHHEGRSSRRTSGSSARDTTERKSKSKTSRHSSRVSDGLTAAKLKDLDRESRERERDERRERRKHRSKSKSDSRSDSIARTDEEYYEEKPPVPPLPMQSVGDSELTRESIMSAETNDTFDRPASSQKTTPILEVAKGSPRNVPLPESRESSKTPLSSERTRTLVNREIASPVSVRSQGDRSTKSSKSVSTNARYAALSAAGLGGAAGGLYGHHRDKSDRSRSRQSERVVEQERDASPVQSDASDGRGEEPAELQLPMRERAAAAADSRRHDNVTTQSASSGRSTPSVQYPTTQERDQGINRSDSHVIDSQRENYDPNPPVGHRSLGVSNGPDRDSQAFEEKRVSGFTDWSGARQSWSDSLGSPLPGRDFSEQHVRDIAANPQLMDNSFHAQSETASMVNPSQLSSYRGTAEPSTQSFAAQSFKDREQAKDGGRNKSIMLDGQANESHDRWRWLKENAKARTASEESVNNTAGTRDLPTEDNIKLGASSLPDADHPMPEIGYARDDETITNPSLREEASSVLEGTLGDENENRDRWPYEPTPDLRRQQEYATDDDKNEQYVGSGNTALMGASAGLGIGGATAGRGMQQDEQREGSDRSKSSASRADSYSSSLHRDQHLSPGNMKDEGYISAANPRSQDSFSKPASGMYGTRDRGYDPMAVDEDPFAGKGSRYAQSKRGLSTGYDAATGQGINGIQSQDIVALMDHLSVRDGQRSARDNELIVTLVRSAAEMRENFDQVKKLIDVQSSANLKNQDKNTDRLMSRILGGGPKPQVLGSPRTPTGASSEDVPQKKQNIFKRALKGLSSKSSNDVTRIEDMLVQLLDEVEALKTAQATPLDPQTSTGAPRGSFDVEQQRLQQVPDPGYEPEGQAGTGSTPSHSGYFSPQQPRRSGPQMHSGFGLGSNRVSGNRVSTVYEDEQEFEDEPERMITPTQEAQRHRSVSFGTPQRPSGETQFEMSPNVPFGSADRNDRRSNKTLLFPKNSRWSKTTEDSSTDKRFSTETAANSRPYSQAFSQGSQSGEHVNALPGADGQPYEMHEDERLRSANSLAREAGEQQRAQSPLIPSDVQQPGRPHIGHDGLNDMSPESAEDPKYTSHRDSLVALAHPQPRQGPTGRHHNRLETEAFSYSPNRGSPAQDQYQNQARYQRDDSDRGSSPDNELFGSVPALARGPMATRRHGQIHSYGSTPLKANGMMSPPTTGSTSQSDPNSPNVQRQPVSAPPRPPKIQDAPAIPPKIALNGNVGQQQQDQQQGYGFPQTRNTQQLTPQYSHERAAVSPAHSDSAHSRTNTMSSAIPSSSELSLEYEDDQASPTYALPQLERKRSPYMPGGPLAPIEERYSMEGDRSSLAHSLSQRSRNDRDGPPPGSRSGQHSRAQSGVEQYLADVAESDERSVTPSRSPRPALGAEERGGETRKLTGPREMPGTLKGTVRRKPVSADLGGH